MMGRNILKINGVVEMLAGLVLIFSPNILLMQENIDLSAVSLAKLYGILAFFFGLISFLLARTFEYSLLYKHILLSVIAFHFVVSLYLYGLYGQGILSHPGAVVVHFLLAAIFLFLYFREMTLFDNNRGES